VDWAQAAITAAILMVAATLQGFIGFGFGIVSMSSLTLTDDLIHAAGVVNLTGLLVTVTQLWRLRAHVLWRPALRILPGILAGVFLGVTALRFLDRAVMVRVLGVTVMLIASWNVISPAVGGRERPLLDLPVGLVSGMLGGAFNTGGPPLIAHLYRRRESPSALKATLQLLFLGISGTRAPTAMAQGLMSEAVFRDAALAVPFVLCGLFAGIAIGQRVDPERFRKISWVALGCLGLALVASA